MKKKLLTTGKSTFTGRKFLKVYARERERRDEGKKKVRKGWKEQLKRLNASVCIDPTQPMTVYFMWFKFLCPGSI